MNQLKIAHRVARQFVPGGIALACLSIFASFAIADEPVAPKGPVAAKEKTTGEAICILRGYVRDADGQPIANAAVTVATPTRDMRFSADATPSGTLDVIKGLMVQQRELTATTNDSGMYMVKVSELSFPTMASIDVAAPGFQRLSGTLMRGGDDRKVRLVPKGIVRENLTLQPAAYFRGIVADTDGKPVGNVFVGASMLIGRGVGGVEHTRTNELGEFEVFNFPLENVDGQVGSIGFEHPDYLPKRVPRIDKIDAEKRENIRVVLDAGQSISGTVQYSTGEPASNVFVKAVGTAGRGRKAVMTDALGQFALKGLPRGELKLSARDLDANEKVQTQLGENGQHANINLVMQQLDLPATIPTQEVLGMTLTDVTPKFKKAYDLWMDGGALILKPGLNWVRLGIGKLEPGNVFWMVGQQRVSGVRDFIEQLIAESESQDGPQFSIRVVYSMSVPAFDGNNTQYMLLTEQDILALKDVLDSMETAVTSSLVP